MAYYQLNGFKVTLSMIFYNHLSLIILVNETKYINFYPTFPPPPASSHCKCNPFIKSIGFFLILLQTLVRPFVINIIINVSHNLNKHTLYKHIWKLFEVGCLHQHTVIAMYYLDRNETLLETFAYPGNNSTFYGPELNL